MAAWCSSPAAARGSASGSPRRWPRTGRRVALLSRKAEHTGPAAAAIAKATGRACLPLVADVRDADQVGAAFQAGDGGAGPGRPAGQRRGGQLPGRRGRSEPQRLRRRARHRRQGNLERLPAPPIAAG